jgi:hypothetical protein
MSARTLAKAEAVVAAAEREPETYGKFVQHMDETGRRGMGVEKFPQADAVPGTKTRDIAAQKAGFHNACKFARNNDPLRGDFRVQ